MRRGRIALALFLLWPIGCASENPTDQRAATIRVGSKKFTESAILGEMIGLIAKSQGFAVERRRDFGSQVAFNALKLGEIDAYVDYTGTISHELLAGLHLVGPTKSAPPCSKTASA